MFLSKLKPLDEIIVELVHPETGEQLFDNDNKKAKDRKPLTVTVKSKESEQSKALTRKRLVENTNKAKTVQKKGKDITIGDVERLEKQSVEDLVALTVGVYLLETEDTAVELSDMARVYKEYPWVKRQVEDALADKGKQYKK